VSAPSLATQVNVPANRLSEIMDGKRAVTDDMASRLGRYFGTDSRFRLTLQAAHSSVLNLFQANDDPCRFWPMRGELRKLLIAPISKAYDLSFLSFHSGNLEQLQNVESPGVEEESMMPKQFAELRDCRMILGKHLCSKLIEGLAYLRFVQFHDLFLIFGI
jgi:addiction module HigA family antidote